MDMAKAKSFKRQSYTASNTRNGKNILYFPFQFSSNVQYRYLQCIYIKIKLYCTWSVIIHGNMEFKIYRLITAYLLLRVNLDKIMHVRWDFDASSARTRRVSALDKHQNWSASALFCLNSRAQSKYAVVTLIHAQRKQTFLSFIMW